MPYEEALRVPLVVRGPGVPTGVIRKQQYSLVDLAPTFLQIAGAQEGSVLDGRSMLGTWRRGAPGYEDYLIQAGAVDKQWWWRGVRSRAFVYARYDDGFEELYDRRADPHQLRNVAGAPSYADELARARARLTALESCAGAACWSG
jgi:arylsulfatase A-like enzyme